ncbi:MAG TPA: hypothetical protein VMV05_10465, partial [bacterium]|nr:hypothetical protein [bacterium]
PSQRSAITFVSFGLYGFSVTYGPLAQETHNSRGPRLYLNPSFTVKDLTFLLKASYVMPNDYPVDSFDRDNGGWLLGVGPIWSILTRGKSSVQLSASYEKIILLNGLYSASGATADLLMDVFQFGINYKVGF